MYLRLLLSIDYSLCHHNQCHHYDYLYQDNRLRNLHHLQGNLLRHHQIHLGYYMQKMFHLYHLLQNLSLIHI